MGAKRYSSLNPSKRPVITLKMTPAYLAILDFVQRYDVIPSSYVRANFTAQFSLKKMLGELAKAHLIKVPGGYSHLNARYRPRPFELSALGAKALAEAGRLNDRQRMNDHFSHAYLRSVIQHSFDRAVIEIPGLTMHTEHDIISHPKAPDFIRQENNPSWFESGGHTLRPDAPIFGYAYKGAHIFFHGFEADRATERQTANANFQRKTIKDMFLRYADYLQRGVYRTRYGVPQITILTVTIGQHRLENMLSVLTDAVADESIRRRFAFKCLPDFFADAPLPPPTAHMVTEEWARVDGPFNILKTLERVAERKSNGRREETRPAA